MTAHPHAGPAPPSAAPEPDPVELELTVLMPCLDEARTVAGCVKSALAFFEAHGVRGEVLVADNRSRDGSPALAREAGARVIEVAERGYGAALRHGIAAARGRFVVMGDADASYDMGALMPFLERLRAGDDLVVGNRFRGGIERGAMPFLHRYLGNPLLTVLGRRFFGTSCRDFYCGQRGFSRSAAGRMDLRSPGMELALEMLAKASLLGMRVSEVPAVLRPDGRDRRPHLRTWRDGWRSLRFLLLYSPRWLFLYPGLALMAIGAGLGAWILPGRASIGPIDLDVHTLLYCAAAIVLGFQLAMFSVFSKVTAVLAGMHPFSRRADAVMRALPLERGLIAGALLILLGLLGSLAATARWAGGAFGDLDPFQVMRLVIPSVLLILLGGQVVSWSFHLGLLRMQWLHRFPAREEP